MRILVVEDEPLLAEAVAVWLRGDAHAVDVVHDGGAALERIAVNDYDVVVLDRDLPVVHGDEVCRVVTSADHTLTGLRPDSPIFRFCGGKKADTWPASRR